MKKNLVKKAVLPAIAALLCSVIALTSVSYAWFSLGTKASVDGMKMEVTSVGGLQVSADGSNFKDKLELADLLFDGNNNHFPTETVTENEDGSKTTKLETFNPVSTDGKAVKGELSFVTAEVVDGVTGNVKAQGVEEHYIVFDFYVLVTNDTTLRLDVDSKVETTNGKESHLSSRVAFFVLGTQDTAEDAQKIGVDNGIEAESGQAKIWEPHKTTRSSAYSSRFGSANDGKEMAYNGLTLQGESSQIETFDLGTDAEELFSLSAGYSKIRVYIWVEGQDVDCINGADGGAFNITLNFSIPENNQ